MRRKHHPYIVLVLLVLITGATFWIVDYMAWNAPRVDEQVVLPIGEERVAPERLLGEEVLLENRTAEEQVPVIEGYGVERVVEGLFVPWSIAFTDTDRFLVSERSGTIREVVSGVLAEQPVYTVADISTNAEEGLMGLAIDPAYAQNKLVYACYARATADAFEVRVVRLEDAGNALENETVVVDGIPAAKFHAGCRLGFGPDNKLYVTTGDATDKNIAQDLSSLGGKILRLNTDGSVPSDNPFEGSPVYSYGHRNPQGIDWNSSGLLLSTEHGPSVFDGPAGGDEVNQIEPGANYGWPVVSHDNTAEGMVDPLIQFTPAEAPGSALVYSGAVFAEWKDDLFFGALKGKGIVRVQLLGEDSLSVQAFEHLELDDSIGRVREVMEGPDGYIYFTTSNRDGRGSVQDGDDAVYRLVPRGL